MFVAVLEEKMWEAIEILSNLILQSIFVGRHHERSVTEIWGRDETKNMDRGGGGEIKNADFGRQNSNMVIFPPKTHKR